MVFTTSTLKLDSTTNISVISFSLWKVNSSGGTEVEGRPIQFPSGFLMYNTVELNFLKETPAGGVIVLARNTFTDQLYVGAYDTNINLLWDKVIQRNVQNNFGDEISDLEVMPSGNILFAIKKTNFNGGRLGSDLFGLKSNGDSLFFKQVEGDFLDIEVGAYNTFATAERLLGSLQYEYGLHRAGLRSGTDGSLIKEITAPYYTNIYSYLAYQPLSGEYRLLTYDIDYLANPYPQSPTNLLLYTLDSSLNSKIAIACDKLTMCQRWVKQLFEDKEGGFYYFQNRRFFDSDTNKIVVGRLDSLNEVSWSYAVNQFWRVDFNVQKIIPLDANNFLAVVQRSFGTEIYSLTQNIQSATGPESTFSQKKKSMKVLPEEVGKISRLKLNVAPNPSSNFFTITTKSPGVELINIIVRDVLGRVVERKFNIAPNGNIIIGHRLVAGIYFVELIQGNQIEKLKLIKQ